MLTFFRRIRKELLGNGATGKYLLYAIGEIALVVIGILIALQINNWNEWKKDRVMEKEVLNDIADNLRRNSEQMEYSMRLLSSYDSSCAIILNALRTDLPYADTLDTHFFWSQFNGSIFVNISMDGYESLKSAGFEILSTKELKDEILNLFESEYKSLEKVANWLLNNLSNKDPISVMNFNLLSQARLTPINYDKLKDDFSYSSFLIRIDGERHFLRNSQDQALKETQRVLQLIKDELGESE